MLLLKSTKRHIYQKRREKHRVSTTYECYGTFLSHFDEAKTISLSRIMPTIPK